MKASWKWRPDFPISIGGWEMDLTEIQAIVDNSLWDFTFFIKPGFFISSWHCLVQGHSLFLRLVGEILIWTCLHAKILFFIYVGSQAFSERCLIMIRKLVKPLEHNPGILWPIVYPVFLQSEPLHFCLTRPYLWLYSPVKGEWHRFLKQWPHLLPEAWASCRHLACRSFLFFFFFFFCLLSFF